MKDCTGSQASSQKPRRAWSRLGVFSTDRVVNGNQATEEERINPLGEKCQLNFLKKEDLSERFHQFFACCIARMFEKRENCHYNNKRNKSVTVKEEAILL